MLINNRGERIKARFHCYKALSTLNNQVPNYLAWLDGILPTSSWYVFRLAYKPRPPVTRSTVRAGRSHNAPGECLRVSRKLRQNATDYGTRYADEHCLHVTRPATIVYISFLVLQREVVPTSFTAVLSRLYRYIFLSQSLIDAISFIGMRHLRLKNTHLSLSC
ncbi:uncharacterized protein LAESUDRAFT_468930 [Laetiporus sulphureus 93-53]|uniref:Uncharacterized protein n=1 Tax=Laetiporus sulphureus 93-53 TaxID=1314785 RepID=A0A165G9B9_9APHY|nr:uncharacterized protein LAESUDRAFT_468930 [Laetiporus sulphureus 93-53]KZT10015.1 hypothetical protein LAESUDRAFT_468930 [Laetiporus sulphureus 93-53]